MILKGIKLHWLSADIRTLNKWNEIKICCC